MDFKVAYDRLKEVTNQGNIVIKVDGKERRLFASENGSIGEYKKGARRWGFRVALDEVEKWKTLEVHAKVTDKLKFKRLCDIVRKMDKSGLWPDLCKTYRGLVSLGFNEFKKYINLDCSARQNYRKQHDLGGDVDCLDYTLLKGLKQINFQTNKTRTHSMTRWVGKRTTNIVGEKVTTTKSTTTRRIACVGTMRSTRTARTDTTT